MFYLRKVLQI